MDNTKSARAVLAEESRDEHRALRDVLFNLVRAFENVDLSSVHFFVNNLVSLAGPHFRYEEETLFPALREALSDEQVRDILDDRDRVIATIRSLRSLADAPQLSGRDARDGAHWAQSIISDVSGCDGLSIITERLSDRSIIEALEARRHALGENLDVLHWADSVRPPRQWQMNRTLTQASER